MNIDTLNFSGNTVLVRVDFNVPMKDGRISDDTRIKSALPTLNKILNDGGRIVVMSHLGRPKGKRKEEYSLWPVAEHLRTLISNPVFFSATCTGREPQKLAKNLKNGEVLLLENLRFHKEEEEGNIFFAKRLADLGDFYINDAFGTAHRSHASTTIIADFFEGHRCFGYLMTKEVENIDRILKRGVKPITAIIGGSKISTKIPVLLKMLDVVDHIIIGGGMAFTFIKVLGGNIGTSICEDDQLETARNILAIAEQKKVLIHLPQDVVVAKTFDPLAKKKSVSAHQIGAHWMGLDIGKKTVKRLEPLLMASHTILWNGPLGVFEFDRFSKGTRKVAEIIAEATKKGAFSLVGGGDSVAAAKKFGLENHFSFVSTGGGALLESLEGKRLPGVEAMLRNDEKNRT